MTLEEVNSSWCVWKMAPAAQLIYPDNILWETHEAVIPKHGTTPATQACPRVGSGYIQLNPAQRPASHSWPLELR